MKTIRTLLFCLSLSLLSCGAFASQVNINTVDAATLAETITGVGPKLAEAIIQYRDKHGPFQSVDDLQQVKGIGAKTIEKNRAKLSVETTPQSKAQ